MASFLARLNEVDDTANSRMELIVKKMCPVRSAKFEGNNRIMVGHVQKVEYIATIVI